MPDVFISYSRDDQPMARRFASALEREGFSVWWDQALNAGETFDRVTEQALRDARTVIVLWSKRSVESRWVRSEATLADRLGKLVPVAIEACERPIQFELTHAADFVGWNGSTGDERWSTLVAGLRRAAGQPARPATAAPVHVGQHKRSLPRGLKGGLAASILLLALAAVAWVLWPGRVPGGSSAAGSGGEPVSIAVLPFVNLSGDPEQEYFSDGLTEEILNELAQNHSLQVMGRTSSFAYKGQNRDLRVIGQELGVANLLEGSVRRDGDLLRITAQLIDAGSGAHLWSNAYDRQLSEVFPLQREVARDVAQALNVRLDVGEVRRAQGGTTNVAAFELYLQAKHRASRQQFAEAAELHREAARLDPQFGLALYGAYIMFNPLENILPERTAEFRTGREEVARRIEALGVDSWWVSAVRQNQLRRAHRWAESEAEGRKALAGLPQSEFVTTASMAILLESLGHFDEAIGIYRRALELDHGSLAAADLLAQALRNAGRQPEEADVAMLQVRPLLEDRGSSARRELLRRMEPARADPLALRAVLRESLEEPLFQNNVMLNIAVEAERAADRDLALSALRRAMLEIRIDWTPGIWMLPAARGDPRFKQILRDMGLVDYWRESGNWAEFCRPLGQDDFECLAEPVLR